MSDDLMMQIAHTLASLDRRIARLEVGEAPASSGTAGTASMTAAEILTAIKTVDGAASGLDADLLDGSHAAAFSGTAHTHTGYVGTASYTPADVLAKLLTVDGTGTGLDADKLDGLEPTAFVGTASYTGADVLAKLLTVDGTASLLDADKLDGLEGSAYSGTAHTHTGYASAADVTAGTILAKLITVDGTASLLDADLLDGYHATEFAGTADVTAGTILAKLLTVDGTTSGLDADLLDGVHASSFLGTAVLANYLRTDGSTPGTALNIVQGGSVVLGAAGGTADAGLYVYGGALLNQTGIWGALNTYAHATLGSALTVVGTANITGNTTIGGTATMTGGANVGAAIDTSGTATALVLKQGGNEILKTDETNAASVLRLGNGRVLNGESSVFLIGDTTYTTYGAAFRRYAGADGATGFYARGTGGLYFLNSEASPIYFYTNYAQRVTVASGGEVGIGAAPTAGGEILQITGDEKITGYLSIQESAAVPETALLGTGNEMNIFMKADKFCVQFKDTGGTVRYLSMLLTGTATTWVHGTAIP